MRHQLTPDVRAKASALFNSPEGTRLELWWREQSPLVEVDKEHPHQVCGSAGVAKGYAMAIEDLLREVSKA